MSNYFIKIDQDRCIGCKACEVHCKAKNRVPVGAKLGQHVSLGPIMKKEQPAYMYLFMPCFHCEQPWCVSACPTGAMSKREDDGIVYVKAELCVGCKACIVACPWKIPQWDMVNGRAIKCDYCRDRVDQGKKPACVTACTTHALSFVNPNVASSRTREDYAMQVLLTEAERA